MGPAPANNDTLVIKTKQFYACIKNCFPIALDPLRRAAKLKSGKILCFGSNSRKKCLKVYKLIQNEFSLEFELTTKSENDVEVFEEIDDDILLLSGQNNIYLFNIKTGQYIQTISLNTNEHHFLCYDILKLSNGLILKNYEKIIFLYKYDKDKKTLEKINEINIGCSITKGIIWEMSDDNILIEDYPQLFLFNYKTKQEKLVKLAKDYSYYTKNDSYVGYNVIDKYLLVSYNPGQDNQHNSVIDIYKIIDNNFIFQSTAEMDYYYIIKKVIKLNDNTLVAYPEIWNELKGCFLILNVSFDNNELKIIKKDAFVAHNKGITSLSKYDENKILTSSGDGDIKLWEI